jgi:hypothetical protein
MTLPGLRLRQNKILPILLHWRMLLCDKLRRRRPLLRSRGRSLPLLQTLLVLLRLLRLHTTILILLCQHISFCFVVRVAAYVPSARHGNVFTKLFLHKERQMTLRLPLPPSVCNSLGVNPDLLDSTLPLLVQLILLSLLLLHPLLQSCKVILMTTLCCGDGCMLKCRALIFLLLR